MHFAFVAALGKVILTVTGNTGYVEALGKSYPAIAVNVHHIVRSTLVIFLEHRGMQDVFAYVHLVSHFNHFHYTTLGEYNDVTYELTDQELTQRIEADKVLVIEKFDPDKIVTAVYLDNEKLQFNIKRFKIETTTLHTKFPFIKEGDGNRLEVVTTQEEPILIVQSGRGSQVRKAKFKVVKLVEVMGYKAVGAKLVDFTKSIEMEWDGK